jgi:hypothetical protein
VTKEISALIPCSDRTGDWFANIQTSAASGKMFKLSAIRNIEPSESLQAFRTGSKSPFERTVIPCFLDFARKGTLGRVRVIGLGIGGTGLDVVYEMQRITAEAQYILLGEGHEIEQMPAYKSVDFRPSGLSQWLSDAMGKPSERHFGETQTEIDIFDVEGLGKFTIVLDHFGSIGVGAEERRFKPKVRIDFDSPRTFEQIDGICSLLDSLFSFLTMTAVKPSALTLCPDGSGEVDIHRHKLLRSGFLWKVKSRDRAFSNFLSSRDVRSVASIVRGVMLSWGEAGLVRKHYINPSTSPKAVKIASSPSFPMWKGI